MAIKSVIFLSFARVKEDNFKVTKEKMCEILADLYSKHSYLRESDVLTETDSPYLAMTKEERNEPANVVNAVHKIAEIKGMDVSTVDEITTNNARKIFKI